MQETSTRRFDLRWRCQALLVLMLGLTLGCATLQSPKYRPEIPKQPELQAPIPIVPCEVGACVLIGVDDWQSIRMWYRGAFIELGASCVALGNDVDYCKGFTKWIKE